MPVVTGLTITLGDADDLRWAQATVTEHHYLHAPVGMANTICTSTVI